MGLHTHLCPSAVALTKAILEKDPEKVHDLTVLSNAHLEFIAAVRSFGTGRELSLAITDAEQAFAWALKGIADKALGEPEQPSSPEERRFNVVGIDGGKLSPTPVLRDDAVTIAREHGLSDVHIIPAT